MTHPQLPDLEIQEGEQILEVGSGPNRLFPHSTTLDHYAGCAPDILHDLNHIPYPLQNDQYDLIICLHVLEHLQNLVAAVTELHRVLKPGGLLFVEAPYFSSVYSFSDPTHVHAFTTRSFDYFVEGTEVAKFGYSSARFEKVAVEIVVPGNRGVNRLVRRWINTHHRLYEERFAFIYPRHTLRFTLKKIAQP